MRRHSPSRTMRHQSPPKRRARGRSLSPLSRSQPAPPGEERGGRRQAPWESQDRNNKRLRSRSREWTDRLKEDVEPPFVRMIDNDRSRNRGKDKDFDKSRDRKDLKQRHNQRRLSPPVFSMPGRMQPAEESYLDHQFNHHGNNLLSNHHDIILDPSSISFNTFGPGPLPLMPTPPKLLEKPRNMPEPPRNHQKPPQRDLREIRRSPVPRRSPQKDSRRSPPREMRRSPPRGRSPPRNRGKQKSPFIDKNETATERIKRLEKLVEKLVEDKSSTEKPKEKLKSYGYQASTSKDIITELIPSNSKFTTSMWLNCINEECLKQGYDEKSCIRFLEDKMTGVIKSWYKTVSNFNFTWPELKMLITKTFPDNVDFAQTLRILVGREKVPEETITQYFFSKVYLCEACKITGENAVSCLIDGLTNPFMKQDIRGHHFLTPELLYSEYLCKFPENEVPVQVDRREVREIIPSYAEEFPPMEMENDYYEEPYQQQAQEEYNSKNRNKKCFTCNKIGHVTMDCRHAPICYICKKKGHIAKKCHFNNSLLVSLMTEENLLKTNDCFVNGHEQSAILDTGSVAVTLKKSIAKQLKLNLLPTMDVLKGFGGALILPIGEVNLELQVDSATRIVKALVVDDEVQQPPVIIGQEFLSQKGVTFYQRDGQVRIIDA